MGDEPAAFLTLAVFVFGGDGEDSVLGEPVAADDGDFFDVASIAEEFSALEVLGIGEVDEDGSGLWVGGFGVEGRLPEKACAAAGEVGGDALVLADGGGVWVGVIDGLDDEEGFAGFVGYVIEVVDFALGVPGSLAFCEEVVHGAGVGLVHWSGCFWGGCDGCYEGDGDRGWSDGRSVSGGVAIGPSCRTIGSS